MAEGGEMLPPYPPPQVFVVDNPPPCVPVVPMAMAMTHAPVYPRRAGWRDRLLFGISILALLGVLIEACCIYKLHKSHDVSSQAAKQKGGNTQEDNEIHSVSTETKKPDTPQKPAVVLTGRGSQNGSVLLWSDEGNGLPHEMDYKDGRLTVKQDGNYFLYSKIGFSDFHCVFVNHKMMKSSPRYGDGTPLELMQSTRYECPRRAEPSDVRNSYLGGVFQLHANDTIYVEVVGKVKIRHQQTENFFGAFML